MAEGGTVTQNIRPFEPAPETMKIREKMKAKLTTEVRHAKLMRMPTSNAQNIFRLLPKRNLPVHARVPSLHRSLTQSPRGHETSASKKLIQVGEGYDPRLSCAFVDETDFCHNLIFRHVHTLRKSPDIFT